MANEIEFTEPGYKEVWLGDRFISRHRVQEEATESALRHAIENGPGEYRVKTPDRFVKVRFVVFKQPTTTAPSPPTGLTILSFDAGTAILDWNNNSEPNLSGYRVYRSENGVTFELVASTANSTYTVTGLAPAVTHWFKVLAYNSLGQESAFSETVSGADVTPPAIPTGLLVVATTGTTVTLDWNDNTDTDFAYYRVYRSTNGTTWTLASGDLTNSVHVVTGLVSETLYYFHVRATDQSGNESAASSVVQSTTSDITAPANATNFAILASSTTETTLFMTWTASVSSDVAGYRIYRSTDNVTYSLIATTGLVTFYEATGLSATTLYYFKISAIDEVPNESSQSSAISYTTAPNWIADLPAIEFTEGTASSFELGDYITPPPVTITQETGTALSTIGVTIDSTNKQLDYDGVGTGSLTGVSLRIASTNTALTDWLTRISGSNVVWYQGFESDAEVDNFRFTGGFSGGNDPLAIGDATAQYVRRRTDDGPTGTCLEVYHPVGDDIASSWKRPFSPLMAPGNGKAANDPAGGGAVLVSYTPTSGGSEITNFGNRGLYGHTSYGGTAQGFDGDEFYLQFRVKVDPNRITGGNQSFTVGKLLYLTHTFKSLTSQEIVTYSYGPGGDQGTGKNYFRMYGGWQVSFPLNQEVSPSDGIQPGGAATDWYYSGGWDTLMYHFVMGRAGVDETLVEIFAAHPGETSFTRIWNQTFPFNGFEGGNGLNCIIASTYNNGNNFPQAFYHRYAQFIFSKSTIPCPQDNG